MSISAPSQVLPPAFVNKPTPEALTTAVQLDTYTKARAQLAASHWGDRRRRIWGAAADGSIDTLKHAVSELVREYLLGGDLNEAILCADDSPAFPSPRKTSASAAAPPGTIPGALRATAPVDGGPPRPLGRSCVKELEAPSFHHEVVKRLAVLSLDHGAREHDLACALVARLHTQCVFTVEQVTRGCTRLLEAVPDLRLDNPKAAELLADFFDCCAGLDALTPAAEWAGVISTLRSDGPDAAIRIILPDEPH